MKVSKEQIVGVMMALQRYAERDHDAEHAKWKATIDEIYDGLCKLTELRINRFDHGLNGQPYPNLQIESGLSPTGLNVQDLLLALRNRPRKIVLAEDEQSADRAFLYPQCIKPGDAADIITAIRQIALSHRSEITS